MGGIVVAIKVFAATIVKKGILTALFATAVGKTILFVAGLALSLALRPRIDLSEQDTPGQELKVRFQTDHPITVLVGQTATAGHVVWANTRGADNRYLERIFVLSDYACDGFVKLYGDGEELTLSGDPTISWVTCTNKYQDKDNNDMLSVRLYLGSEDQTADSQLIAAYGDLDSNFRLRGKTYAIVRCDYDPEYAFSGGEPQLLWELRGAPVFDPREASHDAADPSTWAWSDNPALIAAQYYQGWTRAGKTILGAGWDRSRIPEADLIAAANECDEEVSLKAGGTEKRYRAGGPLYSSRSHRGNIEKLLLAMDGEVDDTAGEVRILPGVERATVKEIKWDDILSASTLELDPELDPAEGINKVLSRHPDPANQYQVVELPERTSATYVTEDGGAELTLDTAFDLVNSSTQGQRLGKRLLERARAQRRLSLTVRLKYIVLEKGDRVTLDATLRERLRLPETQWRVEQRPAVSLQRDEQGLQVNLVLREHPDAIGDWTPASDELDIGGAAATTRPGAPTLTLSGFAVAGFEAGSGSAVYPSGRATWTTPVNPAIRTVTVEIREDGDNTTLQSLPTVRPSEGVITFGRLAPDTTYQARYILGAPDRTNNPSAWVSFTTTANDSSTAVPWPGVFGTGRPEDNATLGADWAINLASRPGELVDGRVAIGLNASGELVSIIPLTTRTSSDILSRSGGGTFTGDLSATYGARAGVDLRDSVGNTLGDSDVRNNAISIAADGTLSGAGGGQVTIGGLGFTGDLNATYGADWSGTVTNRPTELTDGRIATALDASGILQTSIPSASQIPSLPASQLGSGTLADARVAQSNVTQHGSAMTAGAIVGQGALATKSTVDDPDVAAGKSLVASASGAPTPSAARLYIDTGQSPSVGWLDDGVNVIRISSEAQSDALDANRSYNSTTREVVCRVKFESANRANRVSVAAIASAFWSDGTGQVDDANFEGEWSIYLSDTEVAEGAALAGTLTLLWSSAAGSFTADGSKTVIDDLEAALATRDGGVDLAPIPDTLEGDVWVYLAVRRIGGTGAVRISTGTSMTIILN